MLTLIAHVRTHFKDRVYKTERKFIHFSFTFKTNLFASMFVPNKTLTDVFNSKLKLNINWHKWIKRCKLSTVQSWALVWYNKYGKCNVFMDLRKLWIWKEKNHPRSVFVSTVDSQQECSSFSLWRFECSLCRFSRYPGFLPQSKDEPYCLVPNSNESLFLITSLMVCKCAHSMNSTRQCWIWLTTLLVLISCECTNIFKV